MTKQDILTFQSLLANRRQALRELVRITNKKQFGDGRLAVDADQERLQNLKAIDDVYKDIEYIKSRLAEVK